MIEKITSDVQDMLIRQQYAEAEQYCIRLLPEYPDKHEILALLGEVFFQQGRSMEAQLFFEKAVEYDNDFEPPQRRLEQITTLITALKQPFAELINQWNQREIDSDSFRIIYRMLREKDHKVALIELVRRGIDINEDNWKVVWMIAQDAAQFELIEAVDSLCGRLLEQYHDFWPAMELPKHVRGFYASHLQDKLIEQFFETHIPRNMFFVDAGANDGVHFSMTRRLVVESNWKGICLEPVKENYCKLLRLYDETDIKCVHCAPGGETGDLTFDVNVYEGFPDILVRDSALFSFGALRSHSRQETAPMRKLNSVLDEFSVMDIDLLCINHPYGLLEALQSIDLNRFHPQLITLLHRGDREQLIEFLSQFGYSVYLDTEHDIFFHK